LTPQEANPPSREEIVRGIIENHRFCKSMDEFVAELEKKYPQLSRLKGDSHD